MVFLYLFILFKFKNISHFFVSSFIVISSGLSLFCVAFPNLMSFALGNKIKQGRAVSKKPFILVVYRGSTSSCINTYLNVNQGVYI